MVMNSLGSRIVRGELPPGAPLEPETLMIEFEVSRTVIREALKTLAAKGLVDARPKLGTHATDRSRWQLLDVDVMRWRVEGVVDRRLVLELDQVRTVIEPSAAAMAAEAHSPEQLATIREAHAKMAAAFESGDESSHVDNDVAFHLAILAASGNELLERFEVILEPALRARHALATKHAASREYLDLHLAVYEAIREGDAEAARKRAAELMQSSAHDLELILNAAHVGS
ncbi:hypothetical protein ASF80_08410 [Microbacterium sp. Leaf159]|nr:hypothetical protein ASF80_08410 [Microbacterium sp. Leaf159]